MERFYSETQTMVGETVRKFAEDAVLPAAAAIDRDDAFPDQIYGRLAEMGLFGAGLPEEAGGSGFDTVTLVIAMEELARCSGSVGNIYAIPLEAARFLLDPGHRETVDEIAARIELALEYLSPDQLWLNPDCGLQSLPRDSAVGKLRNLATAAARVRDQLGPH